MSQDKQAIGYVSMGLTHRPGIRGLSINGMPANHQSITEELYPYVRLVRFYMDKKNANPAIRRFLRFVESKQAHPILEETGFVHPEFPTVWP